MLLSYIRVSSEEQKVDRQVIKMKELGVEERFMFIDKATGANFDRPQYKAMKQVIREGDLIYIDSLDRLGRDYDGIIREWKYITRDLNADIVILDNQSLFDSRKFKAMGDMGKLMEDQFLSLLAYVAEQERKKIRQRQAEGISAAKAKGTHLGRPKFDLNVLDKNQKAILDQRYPQWKSGEITAVNLMNTLNLKKNTFYKIIKQYEQVM